jgi:hypothetical protein
MLTTKMTSQIGERCCMTPVDLLYARIRERGALEKDAENARGRYRAA